MRRPCSRSSRASTPATPRLNGPGRRPPGPTFRPATRRPCGATEPAWPFVDRDYLAALQPDALRGKRIGVWRTPAGENAEVIALLQATIERLRAQGATVVDVELPFLDPVFEAEFPALLVEFKHDI